MTVIVAVAVVFVLLLVFGPQLGWLRDLWRTTIIDG